MRRLHAGLLAAVSLLAAAAAHADVRLEVDGQASVDGDQLQVGVEVVNSGSAAASAISVRAALDGVEQTTALDHSLEPGATVYVSLSWPRPRVGTHAVLLRLAYHDAAQNREMQQPAWLLVAVGDAAPPCLSISMPEHIALVQHAPLHVSLASRDGSAHTARLRFATSDGLRVLDVPDPIAVPAEGTLALTLRVLRAGAPAETTQGLVAALTTLDGPAAATTIATTRADIVAPVRWAARLRVPAVVVAIGLLLGSAWVEWRRHRPAV